MKYRSEFIVPELGTLDHFRNFLVIFIDVISVRIEILSFIKFFWIKISGWLRLR